MRANQNVTIQHGSTILAPYQKQFVEQYHEWMQDKELLKLTKSEPLTLQEEYDMQEKWMADDDKLTFIIFDMDRMIGDVNLFTVPDFEVENLVEKYKLPNCKYGELEIMIADANYRGKGHGQNAIKMMIAYAKTLGYHGFIARISVDNSASLQVFKRLNFSVIDMISIFDEFLLLYSMNGVGIEYKVHPTHVEDRCEISTNKCF